MSKKAEKKQQEKVIQDRTFGLKNKNKSKTVQQFCKGVANMVKNQGVSVQKLQQEEFERKKLEAELEAEQKLIASLYKSVDAARQLEEEEEEVDPKSIICEYFKQGLCQKGKKCKFSHDMSLEQKTAIIDLYTDQREQLGDDVDTCKNWDEKTLKDVVEAHQKQYKSQKPTEIVCDYFLEALEKGKYGWKWVCPNGMTCHYKHCLPQGYVFRKQQEEKQKENIPLEDLIDKQRDLLQGLGQKVSKDMFDQWKRDREIRKQKEKQDKVDQQDKKGQKQQKNNLTGRALFKYDPSLFVDDDEAADQYEREEIVQEEEEDEQQIQEDQEEDDQPMKIEQTE
ncbi:hypothetical protein pb186bvf_006286 [Paramecium bursaria]